MSATIDAVLQNAVGSGAMPNVVAMAADHGGVIYEGAAGPRVAGTSSDPVSADTHLRIMSMTKVVTTVAALQLVERGDLDLDAPVDTYRPEFAELQVLEGFDGDTPRLRPPASRATVRQLITHTSGLAYWFWNGEIKRWEAATGTPNILSGSTVIFTAPLVADPGTSFEYGINTDWLGRVVEAVAGRTLDAVIAEGITEPLGMGETTFLMTKEQRAHSIPVHLKDETGAWTPTEIDISQEPEYFAGGHGLHSTPREYMRFQQMLLRGGELDGVRILQEPTVDAMFTNQIGAFDFPPAIRSYDGSASCDLNLGPGYKWGYGLLINSADVAGMRRAGSGAWAGLLNSHFWVDRTAGVTGAIYTQFLPFATPEAFAVYTEFEKALYASL